MKFLPIIAALALPFGANAQSLHETHKIVWHPAGKTPSMTYHMRARPACVEANGDHRAGRGQMVPPVRCRIAPEPRTDNRATAPVAR